MAEKKKKQTDKTPKEKPLKKRYWTFVLYPESAPENWKERLKISGLTGAISPLHDADINPTGEPKKPHYHIVLIYSGPTTYAACETFTKSLNGTIPQVLESVKGMYRYFTHKDNPEKAQYMEGDIEPFNGFNISDFIELTAAEVRELKIELCEIIRGNDITEYADIVDFIAKTGTLEQFDVVVNNTFFFNSYVTSRRNCKQRGGSVYSDLISNGAGNNESDKSPDR